MQQSVVKFYYFVAQTLLNMFQPLHNTQMQIDFSKNWNTNCISVVPNIEN
jgi:hypothetical protein